jgi:hypothetical protein
LISIIGRLHFGDGFENRRQHFAFQLECGLIDDQPRRDVHDVLAGEQIVGFQRAAGGHQVDDGIGKSGQRCQFHRPVELDQVDMYALGREVFAGNIDVLGRHLEARALAHGVRVVETGGYGDHHPAPGDLQVDRLVETFTAVLEQNVLAGDAEVGGTVLHIGRGIGGADDDHADIFPIGRDDQRREVSGSSSGSIPAAASRGRSRQKSGPSIEQW